MFHEEEAQSSDTFVRSSKSHDIRRLVYLFSVLIGILLVGTRVNVPWIKYVIGLLLIGMSTVIAKKLFIKEERESWMRETWGFAKTITPLLLVGVFVSGLVKVLLPQGFVTTYMGSNSLTALIIPVLFGVLVYFPTLVEVPMAKVFLDLGMGKGPLMAYLLADPVLSLPSILVVSKIMGTKRTVAYVCLIIIFTVTGGYLFGRISYL